MTRISRFYLLLGVALIGLFFLNFEVAAQNSFKLGVVDTQKVFENFRKAQEAIEILKTAENRLTNQLKDIQNEIKTMEERLTKQKLFLDNPETETLENDIRLKKQELQRELEIGQESILAKQKELFEPLTKAIEDLLQQIGKSEGYSLILEKRLVTLYVDAKYDLTERVLKLLNDQHDQEILKNSKQSSTPPEKETGKKGGKNN
jgi:outer membrane protein